MKKSPLSALCSSTSPFQAPVVCLIPWGWGVIGWTAEKIGTSEWSCQRPLDMDVSRLKLKVWEMWVLVWALLWGTREYYSRLRGKETNRWWGQAGVVCVKKPFKQEWEKPRCKSHCEGTGGAQWEPGSVPTSLPPDKKKKKYTHSSEPYLRVYGRCQGGAF